MLIDESILIPGAMFRKNDFERTPHNTNVRKHTKQTQKYQLRTTRNLNSADEKNERPNVSAGQTLEMDFRFQRCLIIFQTE